MHVTDVSDPHAISGEPDQTIIVSDKPHTLYGRIIQRVELRLYVNQDAWTITVHIGMDGHTVETVYEEGRGGHSPLQDAAGFLMSTLGPAATILRAAIILQAALDQSG